jgi:hypothetical protein
VNARHALPPSAAPGVATPVAALLDVVLVVLFAAIGRASHAEDNVLAGAFATAWPFLLGAAGGWALVRWRSRRWPLTVGNGIPVWFCTLFVGMILRVATGAGTALTFILVAGTVLAVFLLGWRFVAARLIARRA